MDVEDKYKTSSPYFLAFFALELGNQMLKEYGAEEVGKRDPINFFLCLVFLERIVDKLRVLVPPGTSQTHSEDKQRVERQLDIFRKSIWSLSEKLNLKDKKEALEYSGNNLKSRFLEP